MKLKQANPQIISQEIKKLLEEGIIYEPRPGRVRYLG
jgi:DNA-binding transcriptional ArsR family regulator